MTQDEYAALVTIVKGSPLLQPIFPEPVAKGLLNAGLVRQTLGGTLKATDTGMMTIYYGHPHG